jgi:hypothetical protein
MSKFLPTLEQRVASALTSDITSTDLAMLITAVETAAAAADADATEARERALDPGVVVDTAKVGAAVATAELTRDRLQAALPRLRVRYAEVRKQEDIAAWKADAEKLVARRDTLAREFFKLLPPELLKRIAEHLNAMRAFDKQVDALNRRRLDDRSVRPLGYATPELARELKIPDMEKPGQFLWPPPQPLVSPEMIAALCRPDFFNIPDAAAGRYIEERNRRMLEDNRRQVAEAEQRRREFEKQKAAEA